MNKKIARSRIVAGAALTLSLVGVSVLAASPASALGNCVSGYSSVGAYSKCGSPANALYRTVVLCQNIFTLSSYNRYGNTVSTSSSNPSTVQGCGLFERYYGTPWAQSQ